MIRVKKTINGVNTEFGSAFRKLGPVPTVMPPDPLREPDTEYLRKNQVIVNWYPKIQAMKSAGAIGGDDAGLANEAWLTPRHVAFLDLDRLYFELERFKAERGWYNLNLTRDGISALLGDTTWYQLLIPDAELRFDSFNKVFLWQEIALTLLRKYVERYYTFRKSEWELPHLEYQVLADDDANFPTMVREGKAEYGYRISVEESAVDIVEKLTELKTAIEAGAFAPWEYSGIKAISFANHLYQPLLFLSGDTVEVSPAPLNKGEARFVEDIKAFKDANPKFFAERNLYVLRNQSKGRGVGFFEAGNFYPDFIIWQVNGDRQSVAFVDPKGVRNVPFRDPKIEFHETVKKIQKRLGDPNITLDSFIVSNTRSDVMERQWGVKKPEMTKRHVLFQDEADYIGTILASH